MKTIICDKTYQKKWDEFVKSNSSDFGLLQSWAWGEFQKSLGREIFRIAVVDDHTNKHITVCSNESKILAVASAIKMPLRLGKSYFYVPRGPILCQNDKETKNSESQITNKSKIKNYQLKTVDLLLNEIKESSKKEGVIFTRFEPVGYEVGGEFKNIGQVQPKTTLILSLNKSEDDLLAQMKSKTRYNIRVAKKRGVEIDEGDKYFNDFWRLTGKTADRQEIITHKQDYYQKMIESLGDKIKVRVAKTDGKVIVANLVVYIGDWCVYLHGASDYEYRNTMAPFLLQWNTIVGAKKLGFKYYDFWGVDEKKWPGVTRFKKGFAPNKDFTTYPGAYDVAYQKVWYNIYRMLRKG